MRSRGVIAFLILLLFSLLLARLLSPSEGRASFSSNLLQNPGFEEGKEGWRPDHSTTDFVTVTNPVHSGDWAASLNNGVGTATIHIYQDVPVMGGGYYTLFGWAYKDSPDFSSVYLQIEWRDALGAIGHIDSNWLTEDEDAYHLICIPRECNGDGLQAPNNAIKARIKAIADIGAPNPTTPVFFDDLSLTFQGSNSKVYLPLIVKDY